MKKFILLFIGVFTLTFNAKAQDGIESILLTGLDDANKLTKAYMNPAMKGLIYGMNSGWYHTAKVHKKFGFDFSFGLNASIVPSKDELFAFADLGLSSNIIPASATSATVAGSEDIKSNVAFQGTIQGQTVTANFEMPGGAKESLPLNAVPTPTLQFNLGLPYEFEAMLRVVPKIESDGVNGQLLGVGLKKEITDWFGPLDRLPLHVSLLASYTSMKVNYDIDDSSISGQNQRVGFKLNSFTVQGIASLNFPIVNVYGGVGYGTGNSTLRMSGTYDLVYETGLPAPDDTVTEQLTDPLDLGFNAGSFRATVGARLSLGFFKVFADYTLQEYNTLSAGIAVGFR